MKILVASKNKGKLKEIKEIFDCYDIIGQDEQGIAIDVLETGTTFEENAIKKAVEIKNATGMVTLADDSGLLVDYLSGAPGVYSARYAGENATDLDRINKLLFELKSVPKEKRTARFVAVVALCYPNGEIVTATGVCEGYIAAEPKGEDGFGYDPIFVVSEFDKTFAELDSETKNRISHRGLALKTLKTKLKAR